MNYLKRFGHYVLAAGLSIPSIVYADVAGIGTSTCKAAPAGTPGCGGATLITVVNNIIKTVIIGVGVVSVIMVIVGGLRYSLSAGDSSATKGAKDTILYAIIGLVVASAAWAFVSFIAGRVS